MKVAIVGAGIAGLTTAWSLTKRGVDVTLFEQGPIPNPLSASGDQHRLMRRAYGDDDGYSRLITEALEAWDELWEDLGECHYAGRGVLAFNQFPNDGGSRFASSLKRGGFSFETWSPQEAAERYPYIDPNRVRRVHYMAEGGALLCQKIGASIARWLNENGALLRPETRVTAVDAAAGKVVVEGGEEAVFDKVVVTAGAWVLKLFPELAGTLTICRTAAVYLDPPDDLKAAWDTSPAVQNVGGNVVGYILPPAGGTELKFAAGVNKRLAQDPDADRIAAPGEGELLRDLFVAPIARVQEYKVKRVVTCAYTFTEDHRFYSHPKGKALVVSPCSGHGYKFGASVGRRVADGVLDGDMDLLLRWLRSEEHRPRQPAMA
ncbi:FAD-dependent oxidoreductase [Acetobacteraceae bacterium H6797]|nr:FAD-dependent oxidoreductase [Acetobacteraceae bacterium H6797]